MEADGRDGRPNGTRSGTLEQARDAPTIACSSIQRTHRRNTSLARNADPVRRIHEFQNGVVVVMRECRQT